MRRNRILALSLVLVLMFSTVVGCGKSEVTGDNNSTTKSADVESTKEATTEAVESTETEWTTSSAISHSGKKSLNYSEYPISEETKKMLVEKLTNLELKKGEEFNMYSLPFKENENSAYYYLSDTFAHLMYSPIDGTGVLKCEIEKFKISKVENEERCITIYWEIIYVGM